MRVQHENRSSTERRHYDLASLSYVEVEQRSDQDRRAPPIDDDVLEHKTTLSEAFFSAGMLRSRNKR